MNTARADESEKSILSAALHDPACIPQIADLLEPEHFYSGHHQKIWQAIYELLTDGAPVDIASLAAKLQALGHFGNNNLGSHLGRLMDEPAAGNIAYHAKLIRDSATLREMRAELTKLKEQADKESDPEKILNCTSKALSIIQRSAVPSTTGRPTCLSACDLMNTEFPEPKWAIPGLLVDGFSFLVGRPKQGKSILALNIALAVAYGGKALGIDVDAGQVIYLPLEDPWRRIKSRMRQMLDDAPPPEDLILFNEWPRTDAGGLEQLERELKKYERLRLVIIDTFQKIKGENRLRASAYEFDYQQVTALKTIADQAGIAMLVIHHLRKAQADDIFDQVSGSLGLTGAADSTLILDRKTGQADAVLHVTGRDVESAEYALRFDPRFLSWNLLGEASEIRSTEQIQAVYDAIKEYGLPMGPKEIAAVTEIKERNLYKILATLQRDGTIKKAGRGNYIIINK